MLNNEIPEVNISISAYSFKLFEKEVYLILSSDYIESFNRFFNLLNKKVNIEEAKKYLVQTLMQGCSQYMLPIILLLQQIVYR